MISRSSSSKPSSGIDDVTVGQLKVRNIRAFKMNFCLKSYIVPITIKLIDAFTYNVYLFMMFNIGIEI